MKILVTGGTGQIGTFLCGELASRGDEVVSCDVKTGAAAGKSDAGKVKAEIVDISIMDNFLNVVKSQSPDCIVHLAAVVLLESMRDPALSYRVNIVGTNNVLEGARRLEVKKVVFASSVVVYGPRQGRNKDVVDEEDPTSAPADPYSTSKMATELMGRHYKEAYGIDINCMRIAAAWGPGRYQGYTGQFNDYVRRVAVGERPTFPPDFSYAGAKLRWLYVKDVANVFAHVAKASKTTSYLYNTGSKTPFKATDVVGALNEIFHSSDLQVKETSEPTRISEGVAGPNGLDVDCARMYRELGFIPRFTLDAAMRDMVNLERSLAGLSSL